jgi:hypothetical protein
MDVMSRPHYFVTAVQVLDGHRLRLTFQDRTSGEVDLSDVIARGGVFASLSDPAYFSLARVDAEGGTVVWPNEVDIAPETLYARAHEGTAAA